MEIYSEAGTLILKSNPKVWFCLRRINGLNTNFKQVICTHMDEPIKSTNKWFNKNEGINPVYTTLRIKDELILLTYKDDWQVFSTVCSEWLYGFKYIYTMFGCESTAAW